ncbi:hypothetical protein MBLNU230_g4915t1 [Neophaeotheca triangularis]
MASLTGDPKAHAPSDFAEAMTGHCLCGSITVTLHDAHLFDRPRGHICNCANCRAVAGSFSSANLLIENEKVSITDRDGTLRCYEDSATGSGKVVSRFFCGRDGNPIKSETPSYPGKVVVKMGMMPRIPQPEAESFALHRHPWQGKMDGVKQYKIKFAGPDAERLDEED